MPVGAIIGGAVIGGGASLAAGAMSSSATQSAANTQAAASDRASQVQLDMYNRTRNDLAPYMALGPQALDMLNQYLPHMNAAEAPTFSPFSFSLSDLQNDPGYQFLQSEGQKAVTNSYAARGLADSGPVLQAGARYATDLASTHLNDVFNRAYDIWSGNNQLKQQDFLNRSGLDTNRINTIMQLLSTGENAAAGAGNAGITTGNSIAQNIIGAGNARAAASIGSANAWGGALNGVAGATNNLATYMMLNNALNPASASTWGSPAALAAAGV